MLQLHGSTYQHTPAAPLSAGQHHKTAWKLDTVSTGQSDKHQTTNAQAPVNAAAPYIFNDAALLYLGDKTCTQKMVLEAKHV